jgi:hypothetical protein
MSWLTKLLWTKQTIDQTKEWAAKELQNWSEEYQKDLNALESKLPELKQKGTFLSQNLASQESSAAINKFIEQISAPAHERDFSQLHNQFKEFSQIALPKLKETNSQETLNFLKELEQQFIAPYTSLKNRDKIVSIQNTIAQIEEIQKERHTIEQHRLALIDKKEKIELEKQKIQNEKEQLSQTEEFLKIKQQLIERATERKQAEQEITALFNSIKPVLLSYSEKTGSAICKAYATNPLDAIIRDYSLNIAKNYADLYKETISEDIHKELSKLNKTNLGKLLHSYASAKKKEADLHNTIANREIMKKYEELLTQIKQITAEITDVEEEISVLIIPTDKELKSRLQEQLNGRKITLI